MDTNDPVLDPQLPRPIGEGADARRRRRIASFALVGALVLAGAYGWYDARRRIGATQEELARCLRDIETDSREAKLLAKQAQETMREAQAKIAVLEGKLAESQNQQLALENLYQ